jgi:hypothetical protein
VPLLDALAEEPPPVRPIRLSSDSEMNPPFADVEYEGADVAAPAVEDSAAMAATANAPTVASRI